MRLYGGHGLREVRPPDVVWRTEESLQSAIQSGVLSLHLHGNLCP